MKVKIKKTNEVLEDVKFIDTTLSTITIQYLDNGIPRETRIKNLSDIEEVKDYEEPKEYWTIDWTCTGVTTNKYSGDDVDDFNKSIGNYFETKEEAEKAVRKLEAWKLLKDMGFKIEGIRYRNHKSYIEWSILQKVRDDHFMSEALNKALHLLFGDEE